MIPLPHPDDAPVPVQEALRRYREARAAERDAFAALARATADLEAAQSVQESARIVATAAVRARNDAGRAILSALEAEEVQVQLPIPETYPGPDGL